MAVFAVTTARGPAWDPSCGIRDQQGWDEHAAFADALVRDGLIILGGPITGAVDEVALVAMVGEDEPAIRSVFAADPWIVNDVLRIKQVRPWQLWLDSRRPAG
jgi:uncharacterized protein YciI